MHRHDMIILFDDGCCRGVEAVYFRYAFLGLVDDKIANVYRTRYESENRDNTSYVGILGI